MFIKVISLITEWRLQKRKKRIIYIKIMVNLPQFKKTFYKISTINQSQIYLTNKEIKNT